MSKDVNYSGGVGFVTLLGVLFIGLKLTGYIDWSWWLVLLPIYGQVIFGLILLAIAGLIYLATRD